MRFAFMSDRFALAVIVAALALPVVSVARSNASNSKHATQNSAQMMPTGNQFITDAAKVNLGEIELGKLAEQKGGNAAVRDFGKRMVDDHTQLQSQLESLAKSKGVTLPTQAGSDAMTLRDELAKDSGMKFDDDYMQHMLSGHKQAIDNFENEIEHGQNPAFKTYAENALPVIQDHIRIAENVAGKMQLSGRNGLESPTKAITARG